MFGHLRKVHTDDIRFCDRCSSVCGRRCQADAFAQRTFEQGCVA
jgi:hypothetical protein